MNRFIEYRLNMFIEHAFSYRKNKEELTVDVINNCLVSMPMKPQVRLIKEYTHFNRHLYKMSEQLEAILFSNSANASI